MNESYRLRYTNQIVGVFLLIFLLFFFALSILVLRVNYFVRPTKFLVDVAEADLADLHRGAEVLILGEYVGEVDDIRYAPDSNRVLVELAIEPSKRSLISEDSVVQLERKLGVGAPVLTIRRDPSADELKRSATGVPILPFRRPSDRVDQLAEEVKSASASIRLIQEHLDPTLDSINDAALQFESTLTERANPAFERYEQASESFRRSNEAIRPDVLQTSEAIRQATHNLEQRISQLTETVNTLVENDLRRTLAEINESSDDVSDAAQMVEHTSGQVGEDVGVTLARMRDTIQQVSVLTDETRDVVRIIRGEADELPGTTARVADTISEANDLVDDIQGHWLLRGARNRNSSTHQISPSAVRGGMVQ